MANEFTFEITRMIGVISENTKTDWKREINLVSWNGGEPKFDIREWSPDHQRMSRGITMSCDEARKVSELISALL